MKINLVEFDNTGRPSAVAFTMSLDEAGWLAVLCGEQTGTAANQLLPCGDQTNSDVYEGLVGSFFNRFWDAGVTGWLAADSALTEIDE